LNGCTELSFPRGVSGTIQGGETTVISYSISTLLTRNLLDVFGENDPARRRAAVDEIFTEDCVFYDPKGGAYQGRDEIYRIAGAVKATHPDFQYQPIAEPEEVGNGGRIAFRTQDQESVHPTRLRRVPGRSIP